MTFQGDPFRTLGIAPGASINEIKSAYRRLAKQFHLRAGFAGAQNPGNKPRLQKSDGLRCRLPRVSVVVEERAVEICEEYDHVDCD